MSNFDRAAHCRSIASRGGLATVAKYGRSHMSKIGRHGFDVTTERYFQGEAHHKAWLRDHCGYLYWEQTGLAMKHTLSGETVWPTKPVHPSRPDYVPF
jgi:hypothetical protein